VSVADLPRLMADLAPAARERFNRLFAVDVTIGETDPPPELHDWLERQFGSVDAVRRQRVVRITNRVTLDQTLFSGLRARRPIYAAPKGDRAEAIAASADDPFCSPERQTPANVWGRVRGRRTITGANAAMYDGHHAVIVFDEHDPLAFDAETVVDVLTTGHAWADRTREHDREAVYYFLMWNCLWRAGGSIIHGHAQATLGTRRHYGRVERFRRDALAYRAEHGTGLVDDLVAAHADVGLWLDCGGTSVLAHLTPLKARELLVIGRPGQDERDPSFATAVADVLAAYRDALGVRSFNLALWRPPLAVATGRDEDWSDLPPIIRLVDRGSPARRPSDFGAMELYAASVVGTDPFDVARQLRSALGERQT
jgi:hypothetical protein